jgi:hypothetical protein
MIVPDGNSHFLMAVGRIDGGLGIETADAQLRTVLEAVRRTGKKGSVTLTLEVAPNGEMGFAASVKVTSKAPNVQFGQSFFFQDRHGELTRSAPELQLDGFKSKREEDVDG